MSAVDQLVPDPQVAEEFHVTTMTLWRWDRSPDKIALGWAPKIKIGDRNFRSRNQLEAFKANLVQRALAERGAPGARRGRHAAEGAPAA
jgi:hypothetical protein